MIETQQLPAIDWTDCSLVERVPGKVSGVPILKGTRVQADSILENYEGGSPIEEISDNFDIAEDTIRELLIFAAHQDSLRQHCIATQPRGASIDEEFNHASIKQYGEHQKRNCHQLID